MFLLIIYIVIFQVYLSYSNPLIFNTIMTAILINFYFFHELNNQNNYYYSLNVIKAIMIIF